MSRFRYLLIGRFLRGHPRRWLYYTVALAAWRQYRRLTGTEPELVYRARLGRGERLDMLTAEPLPKRFQTRRWRRRLAAAALAELRARR